MYKKTTNNARIVLGNEVVPDVMSFYYEDGKVHLRVLLTEKWAELIDKLQNTNQGIRLRIIYGQTELLRKAVKFNDIYSMSLTVEEGNAPKADLVLDASAYRASNNQKRSEHSEQIIPLEREEVKACFCRGGENCCMVRHNKLDGISQRLTNADYTETRRYE